VAEVFNKLSALETELPSDDIIDETVDLSYKVDSQTTTTADFNNMGKVTLDEIVNNDELMNDDGSSSNTVMLKKDDNTTDNVVSAEALKALSNLKKYKINQLCTQNLTKLGWQLLGDNVSEERF